MLLCIDGVVLFVFKVHYEQFSVVFMFFLIDLFFLLLVAIFVQKLCTYSGALSRQIED